MAIRQTDQQKRSEDVRKRILQESYTLFHTYGYEKVSMRDIASSCGVTTGTLYHHFKSKTDILKASFRRVIDPERLMQEYCQTQAPLEDLEEFICHKMSESILKDGAEITKVRMFSIIRFDDEAMKSSILENCVRTLVKRAQELGEFTEQLTEDDICDFLCAVYRSATYQYSVSEKPVDLPALLQRRYSIAVQALLKS